MRRSLYQLPGLRLAWSGFEKAGPDAKATVNTKVDCLLVTNVKGLVAIDKISVALATSWSPKYLVRAIVVFTPEPTWRCGSSVWYRMPDLCCWSRLPCAISSKRHWGCPEPPRSVGCPADSDWDTWGYTKATRKKYMKARLHMWFLMRFRVQNVPYPTLNECFFLPQSMAWIGKKIITSCLKTPFTPISANLAVFCRSVTWLKTRAGWAGARFVRKIASKSHV